MHEILTNMQNYDKSIVNYIGETVREKGSYVGKILMNELQNSFAKFVTVDSSTDITISTERACIF